MILLVQSVHMAADKPVICLDLHGGSAMLTCHLRNHFPPERKQIRVCVCPDRWAQTLHVCVKIQAVILCS